MRYINIFSFGNIFILTYIISLEAFPVLSVTKVRTRE